MIEDLIAENSKLMLQALADMMIPL